MEIVYQPLKDWVAGDNLGKVFIAPDPLTAHEWAYSNNNEQTCKWIIYYVGDKLCYGNAESSIVSVGDFFFNIIISRNRSLTEDRGQALFQSTGNAVPLYEITDKTRNLLRCIESLELLSWPIDYLATEQYSPKKEWLYDGYVIHYSIQNRLSRYSEALDEVYASGDVAPTS
jgi:hypothetical protein